MLVQCAASELNNALAVVKTFRNKLKQSSFPIWLIADERNFRIVAGGGATICMSVAADIQEQGAVELIESQKLPAKVVGKRLVIAYKHRQVSFENELGAAEICPAMSLTPDDCRDLVDIATLESVSDVVTLPTDAFLSCVATTKQFRYKKPNEGRDSLLNISIEPHGSSFIGVSTDGYRLIVYGYGINMTTALSKDCSDPILIPDYLADTLSTLKPGKFKGTNVKLFYSIPTSPQHKSQEQLVIRTDTVAIVTPKEAVPFPRWRSLIKHSKRVTIRCDREKLVTALDFMAMMMDSKDKHIGLILQEQAITVYGNRDGSFCQDIEVANFKQPLDYQLLEESSDGIAATIYNVPIRFNVKYLIEGLKVMASKTVDISIEGPESPLTICGQGGIDKSAISYLVMPIDPRR